MSLSSGTMTEALWILGYTRRTPPEIAAENNTASARQLIHDCVANGRRHFSSEELSEIKKWYISFYMEQQKAGG